jgi:uncharacterized damage-inducible protein DinB
VGCESHFRAAHRKVAEVWHEFPADRLTERVLVPPQRGLEDSSRFWSAAMTARHLTIVGSNIEQVIATLSRGEKFSVAADTAKMKPEDERNDAGAIAEYLAFADGVLDRLQESVRDRDSRALHTHPWFGPMTAKDWLWLLGTHTALHLQQLRNIRRGLA